MTGCQPDCVYSPRRPQNVGCRPKHRCKKGRQNTSKSEYKIVVKNPKEFILRKTIQCLVCGKVFRNKEGLNSHIIQLKKTDYLHEIFNKNNENQEINRIEGQKKKNNHYQPLFGKINLRNNDK